MKIIKISPQNYYLKLGTESLEKNSIYFIKWEDSHINIRLKLNHDPMINTIEHLGSKNNMDITYSIR